MKNILFNKNSISRWQADEDTQVMVSNRNGKDSQIFCRADEVQLGDNVWEHSIIFSIDILDNRLGDVKVHYGPSMKKTT